MQPAKPKSFADQISKRREVWLAIKALGDDVPDALATWAMKFGKWRKKTAANLKRVDAVVLSVFDCSTQQTDKVSDASCSIMLKQVAHWLPNTIPIHDSAPMPDFESGFFSPYPLPYQMIA